MIAVRDNQPKLAEAIETFFREAVERDLEDFQYRHLETRDAGAGLFGPPILSSGPGPGELYPEGAVAVGEGVRICPARNPS